MKGPSGPARSAFATALVLAFAALGCEGTIGDIEGWVPPPPNVEPVVVPASLEVIASEGSCTALGAGERLVSVSPEGHAWLITPDPMGSRLRVLDAFDPSSEVVEQVEVSGVQQLQAWSDRDAALIAGDGLWLIEQLARIQLSMPDPLATPGVFCGDPASNGAALANGSLFERRSDGQWWGWETQSDGDAAPSALLPLDGECQDVDNVLWMMSADGTVWRVEPSRFSRPVRFEGARAGAATDGMLAVLESDRLWIGPDAWQPYVFEGAMPRQLSASGGRLWMLAGDTQLMRFDGERYVEVGHALSGTIQQLAAHPGGVWLASGDEVCHQRTGPMVQVQGIRPYARSIEFDYAIQVRSSDPSLEVTAELNGEPVDLTPDSETGWLRGDLRLDEVGWHQLRFDVPSAEPASRIVNVKRLPETERSWAADIAPIYAASCSGSACHIAGATEGPPDLSTFEAWQSRASAIRTRVVDARTMPPASNQGADWGDDQVAIIAQWLEGGMLP